MNTALRLARCPVWRCALQRSIDLLAGRWTTAVLFAIAGGHAHFGERTQQFPGISKQMPSARLAHLAGHEVLSWVVESGKPLRVRYELTAAGRELTELLAPLEGWRHRHLES